MTDEHPESNGMAEALGKEGREILSVGSHAPGDRIFALYSLLAERQRGLPPGREPTPPETLLRQARDAVSVPPDLKGPMIRGVFLASLETARQAVPPGAFALVTMIGRLATGWGRFFSPSLGRDVDLSALANVTLDWAAEDCQKEFRMLVEESLADAGRMERLGVIRWYGALLADFSMLGWFARALALGEGLSVAGTSHLSRAREILREFRQGGPESAMEKLMNKGMFTLLFDQLLARPPVVAALAGLG